MTPNIIPTPSSRFRTGSRAVLSALCAGALALVAGYQAKAVTYPTVNSTNFPSGSYQASGQATPMNYRYFKPVNYNPADTNTLYPLVLFLHGAGEKGTNNSSQLGNGANGSMIFISSNAPDNQTAFPCFWVAPQCSLGDWEQDYGPAQIQGVLDQMVANFHIDPDRIYITGLSMGGGGVSDQLRLYPSRFAAASMMAGWTNGGESDYKSVPFWIFSSMDDANNDNQVDTLRSLGGKPIHTRFNSGGHANTWIRAYNPATPLVAWTMAQRRGQEPVNPPGPVVTITNPSTATAMTTSGSSISLSGTSADSAASVTSVKWWNRTVWDSGAGNWQSGNATGTTSWSATVPLINGANRVNIIATGVAHGAPGNGATTFSDSVSVTRSAGSTPPTVTITSPTSASTYSTSSASLNIGGTASDSDGVSSVAWSNDRGGNGSATGTTTWSVSGIGLQSGVNVITVTATDSLGTPNTDTLTVTYTPTPTNQAPVVNAGSDQTIVLPAYASLSATVTDDGLPTGQTVTKAWTKTSGPGTATFSAPSNQVTNVTFSVAGVYVLRLTANDTALSGYDEVTINVGEEIVVGDVVAAVNCGGSGFTAADGTVYSADYGYSGGWTNTWDGTPAIANTTDDTLYQRYRGGDFTYTFTGLPAGQYLVTLKFAEFSRSQWGAFNYTIQGVDPVAGSFNPAVEAGGLLTAIDKGPYEVTVTSSGTLTIAFSSVSGQYAICNAILVESAVPTPAIAVNCGSSTSFTGLDGFTYAADYGYTGGWDNYWDTSASFANTEDDGLYQRYRGGNFTYAFTGITPGNYTLYLKFAERFRTTWNEFTYSIVASSTYNSPPYAITSSTGGQALYATEVAHEITVGSNGQLNLAFNHYSGYAVLNAILLLPR